MSGVNHSSQISIPLQTDRAVGPYSLAFGSLQGGSLVLQKGEKPWLTSLYWPVLVAKTSEGNAYLPVGDGLASVRGRSQSESMSLSGLPLVPAAFDLVNKSGLLENAPCVLQPVGPLNRARLPITARCEGAHEFVDGQHVLLTLFLYRYDEFKKEPCIVDRLLNFLMYFAKLVNTFSAQHAILHNFFLLPPNQDSMTAFLGDQGPDDFLMLARHVLGSYLLLGRLFHVQFNSHHCLPKVRWVILLNRSLFTVCDQDEGYADGQTSFSDSVEEKLRIKAQDAQFLLFGEKTSALLFQHVLKHDLLKKQYTYEANTIPLFDIPRLNGLLGLLAEHAGCFTCKFTDLLKCFGHLVEITLPASNKNIEVWEEKCKILRSQRLIVTECIGSVPRLSDQLYALLAKVLEGELLTVESMVSEFLFSCRAYLRRGVDEGAYGSICGKLALAWTCLRLSIACGRMILVSLQDEIGLPHHIHGFIKRQRKHVQLAVGSDVLSCREAIKRSSPFCNVLGAHSVTSQYGVDSLAVSDGCHFDSHCFLQVAKLPVRQDSGTSSGCKSLETPL